MRNKQHPLQGYACRVTNAPKNVMFGMKTGEYFVIGRVENKGTGSHFKLLFVDENDPRADHLYELDGGKFTWVQADEVGKSFVSEQYLDIPYEQAQPMCRSSKSLPQAFASSIDEAARRGASKRKRDAATQKKCLIFTMGMLHERGIECSNCSIAIPQRQIGLKNCKGKLFICFRCFYNVKRGLEFSESLPDGNGLDLPTHHIQGAIEFGNHAENDDVHCDQIDMSNTWHLNVKKMKANGQLFGACNSIVAFSVFDGVGAGLVALVRLQIPVRVYITSELTAQAELLAFANTFGIVVIQLGDVHSIKQKHIKMIEQKFSKVHLYMGGPPCQKTALVNTGNADHTPTKEFAQFVTILKWFQSKPSILVETLASSGRKETVDLMFKTFEQFGCTKKIIDSKMISPLRRCRSYFTNIRQTRPIVPSTVGMKDIIERNIQNKPILYIRQPDSGAFGPRGSGLGVTGGVIFAHVIN